MNQCRPVSLATRILVLTCVVPLAAGVALKQQSLLLDDFEAGVTKWTTNDAFKQTGGAEAMLCEIVPTPGAPEDGKARAALVTFRRARESWASVSLPVDGNRWQQLGAKQLSLWFKGDGSDNSVTLMLRTKGGPVNDERFAVQLPLSDAQWKHLLIPLSRLKNDTRTSLEALPSVYLLQFVKIGAWDSLFFSLDQLEVQGEAAGESGKRPADPGTAAPQPPAQLPTETAHVTVDFASVIGKTKLRIGGNLGTHPERIADNAQFRQSVSDLGVPLLRVSTAQLAVPKTDAEAKKEFDFTVLDRVLHAIRSAGAQPIVCIADDPEWQLSEDGFVTFCTDVVKRYSVEQKMKIAYYELFNEPTSGAKAITIQQTAALYNRARKAIRAVEASVKLGGLGEGSAWLPHLQQALSKTDGLDFLSFHFYGARNASASDAELFDAGLKGLASDLPHQIAPRGVHELVARNPSKKGTPIFITECAPNANRGDAGEARDPRLSRIFGAAWWMSFLTNAARWIDVVCVYDLSDESWGLLDARGRAYPAFYAAYMFRTYAPPGSSVCKAESDAPSVLAFAVNTMTAHNVVLVNLGPQPIGLTVTTKGLPEQLKETRLRSVEDNSGLKQRNLETGGVQQTTLGSLGVQVIQFVEKKTAVGAAPIDAADATGSPKKPVPGKAATSKPATPAKSATSKRTPAKATTPTSNPPNPN